MLRHHKQTGFTLIELIVSLGVFSVVITTAVGALLMLVATNDQLQGEQSVMTNLSFALDSMTREIRTGTSYYCDGRANYGGAGDIFGNGVDLDAELGADTQDCLGPAGNHHLRGIAFIEGGDSVSGTDERILYFFDGRPGGGADAGKIYRRIGTGDRVPITSSGIYIHDAQFFVTGSKPVSEGPPDEDDQASVTIQIVASEDENTPAEEWVTLQTTVSQRTLDI